MSNLFVEWITELTYFFWKIIEKVFQNFSNLDLVKQKAEWMKGYRSIMIFPMIDNRLLKRSINRIIDLVF